MQKYKFTIELTHEKRLNKQLSSSSGHYGISLKPKPKSHRKKLTQQISETKALQIKMVENFIL